MNNTGLLLSKRIRKTPFTDRVRSAGVSGFTVVNHMLLPKGFLHTAEEDYWHLKKFVQIWDVSCQRQIQVCGPDSLALIQMTSPRYLKKIQPGQCLYLPVTDENGGMLNDPVLLKIDEETYWLSIADSDLLLWLKGLSVGRSLKTRITEENIFPIAIQGPRADNLMTKIFGKKINTLPFFRFDWFSFCGKTQLIARSGYSKQGGFEIYFNDPENGSILWDALMKAGEEFNVRPGSPNLIERIEAGLISYGNDMTIENNPYECGLGNFCNLDKADGYIGSNALKKALNQGIQKRIMGVLFEGLPCSNPETPWSVTVNDKESIGKITSAAYSPQLACNIGLAMISKPFDKLGTIVEIKQSKNQSEKGQLTTLPFS